MGKWTEQNKKLLELRRLYPSVPQRTFAYALFVGKSTSFSSMKDFREIGKHIINHHPNAPLRSFASFYGATRRADAAIRKPVATRVGVC